MRTPYSDPQFYKGISFRSKLEVKWAQVFDSVDEPWEYEPKTFRFGADTYLPDFYLPQRECWFEVKGRYPNEREIRVMGYLTSETRCEGVIAYGHLPESTNDSNTDDRGFFPDVPEWFSYIDNLNGALYSVAAQETSRQSREGTNETEIFLTMIGTVFSGGTTLIGSNPWIDYIFRAELAGIDGLYSASNSSVAGKTYWTCVRLFKYVFLGTVSFSWVVDKILDASKINGLEARIGIDAVKQIITDSYLYAKNQYEDTLALYVAKNPPSPV